MVLKEDLEFSKLRVRTLVNGEVKQDGPVTDMIFSLDVILEYVSAFMTLEPGDLIATGTPPGVGPLVPGDTVRIENRRHRDSREPRRRRLTESVNQIEVLNT
jgi:5-oxopent-3-ene-1,2,5-tricarboxylate decarboxylase/2-hydroxyhepta-2,4-diene-1,7-dioate isomerase